MTINNHLIPNLSPLLNYFAVPEPAHVSEVGGDGVEPLEPLSGSGHPRLVNQGERNAALTQGLHELWDKPVLVSDFHGELVLFRQFLKEWPEPSEEVIHADERLLVEISELEQ